MDILVLVSKKSKYKLASIIREFIEDYKNVRILELEEEFNRIKSRSKSSKVIIVLRDNNFEKFLSSNQENKYYLDNVLNSYYSKVIILNFDELKKYNNKNISVNIECNLDDMEIIKYTLEGIKRYIGVDNNDKDITSKKNNRALTMMLLTMICLGLYMLFSINKERFILNQEFDHIISIIMLLCASLFCVIFIFSKKINITDLLFEEYSDEYDEKIKEALVKDETYLEDKEEKINALGRMELNLSDIKEFYVWTKKQSKIAFALAIILIFFGIVTFSLIIIFSVFTQGIELSIAIMGTIGSCIIEFIGATALVIYRLTLSQLNHYHRSLHEDERFLSSVNLINNLSDSKQKDEMIKQVINSELELNLIELKQSENKNKK